MVSHGRCRCIQGFFCSCVGFIPIGLSLCFKGFLGGVFASCCQGLMSCLVVILGSFKGIGDGFAIYTQGF